MKLVVNMIMGRSCTVGFSVFDEIYPHINGRGSDISTYISPLITV